MSEEMDFSEAVDMKTIGMPDKYFIFKDGRVVSMKSGKPYVLASGIAGIGYPMVGLNSGEKSRVYYTHRLLALAFIPNPLNFTKVSHIDGNRMNNSLSNLKWKK